MFSTGFFVLPNFHKDKIFMARELTSHSEIIPV